MTPRSEMVFSLDFKEIFEKEKDALQALNETGVWDIELITDIFRMTGPLLSMSKDKYGDVLNDAYVRYLVHSRLSHFSGNYIEVIEYLNKFTVDSLVLSLIGFIMDNLYSPLMFSLKEKNNQWFKVRNVKFINESTCLVIVKVYDRSKE